jgi:hypothetical protein
LGQSDFGQRLSFQNYFPLTGRKRSIKGPTIRQGPHWSPKSTTKGIFMTWEKKRLSVNILFACSLICVLEHFSDFFFWIFQLGLFGDYHALFRFVLQPGFSSLHVGEPQQSSRVR